MLTVRSATEIAFRSMDKKFHSIRLCQAVRELTGRAFLMDGTILRRLRELREDQPADFNYKVLNPDEGLYIKINELVSI